MFRFDRLISRFGYIFGYTYGLLIVSAIFVAGCADAPSETSADGTIHVGLSTGGQQNASPSNSSFVDSVTLTSVRVSIGRIRIKSVSGMDSLDFRSDVPLIVNLNLDKSVQYIGTTPIRPGVYDETRYRLRRIDSGDGQIYLDNPEMRDISVLCMGYLNGNLDSTFTWKTDLNEEQVHKFNPFTVNSGDTVNLVFNFDVSSWFVADSGGTLDPRVGGVKSEIDNNIKTEFSVTTF